MRSRSLAAAAACALLLAILPTAAHAFEYFEHRYVGDLVCAKLVAEGKWPGDSCIITPGLASDTRLTFGDLVAMVDHFAKPDDLASAIQQYQAGTNRDARIKAIVRVRQTNLMRVRAWLGRHDVPDEVCKTADWISADDCPACPTLDPETCFDALTKVVEKGFESAQVTGAECYELSEYEWAGWVGLPAFISLARVAGAHFGASAIRHADEGFRNAFPANGHGDADDSKEDPYYRHMAWLAFASHYFMDRFSSGHIRTEIDKLTSAEAQRVHDYDCTEGLMVTYFPGKALGRKSSTARFHAVGDRCLLSYGGTATRSVVILALAEAIRQAQDNGGQGLAGMRDQWFPALADGNSPVPSPPGYARIIGGSGLGFASPRNRPTREAQPGMSAMLHLEILAPVDLLPAESLQMAYFGGDGTQVFVPVSLQTSDALAWLYGVLAYPFTDDDGRSGIWRFREAHRNMFQTRVGTIASVELLYPFAGWAIIRNDGVKNHAIGTLPLKVSIFDRFSVFLHASAATRDFEAYTPLFGVHIGIEI